MLLAEPARLFGSLIFEVEGFFAVFYLRTFAVFYLRTEKIIAPCEEGLNCVTRLQSFPISLNRFFEAFFVLETMVYI